MAWLDFIKQIRRDEEEEDKRGGGVKNKVFGFLDDVLDTGGRAGNAVVKQVNRPNEGGDSDYDVVDIFRDLPSTFGESVVETGQDVAGAVAGLGREVVVKPIVKAKKTIEEAQDDPRLGNIDELLGMPQEERERLAEAGKDPNNKDGRAWFVAQAQKQMGDLSDEALNKRKGEVQSEMDAKKQPFKPKDGWQKTVFGNEDIFSVQGDTRVGKEFAEKRGAGQPVSNATGLAYGLGLAALDSPLGKPVKAVKEIGQEGIEALVKSDAPEEVAKIIKKNTNMTKAQLAKIVDSVTKSTDADDIRTIVNGRVAELTPKKAVQSADAVVDDATADTLPSKFPVDAPTQSKIDELLATQKDAPAEGTRRLYQGTENGKPTDWYFESPDQLAQYFANRSDNVDFRAVDVPEAAATTVERRPGVFKVSEPTAPVVDAVDPARQFTDVVAQPSTGAGGFDRTRDRAFLQTAQKSPYATKETNEAIQAIDPQDYMVKSQDPVLKAAETRVAQDFDGAMRLVDDGGKWTDEKAATLMALASKARDEGRTDDFIEILKKIDEGGREAGRGIAVLKAWSRMSPEGVVKMAQRQVEDIGSKGKFRSEVDSVKKAVEKAGPVTRGTVTKAVDDAIAGTDKTVGEQVAKRVGNAVSPAKKKKQVDTLVTELTKKIKQEYLPAKPVAEKRTALSVLQETFKRTDEAAEAWPEAQAILREQFKDNADILKQLDEFNVSNFSSPAASKTLDKAIVETMRKNKVKIQQTIKKSWDEQITDISEVAARLTAEGFSEVDARIIAEEVGSRVKAQVEGAKTAALQRMLKKAPAKTQPVLAEKIAKLSNLGALNDADYADLVRAKLDLPSLDAKSIEKIDGLAQKMQGLPEGAEKNDILGEIMNTIADTLPVTKGEKFNAFRYQNLLSSPRTQLRNVAANTFNALITRPATLFTGAVGDAVSTAITKAPRERYFSELPVYYKGLYKGFFDSQEAMTAAWKGTADITNPDFVDQFGKGGVQAARMRNLPKKWTVVSRLMEAQDKMFSGMISGGEYAALMKRGIPEAEARKAANEMAEYSLLRQALDPKNSTEQGAFLSKIDQVSNALVETTDNIPGGRWLVPFIRTPLNFGKQWLEYSPVGLVDASFGKGMSQERRLEALNKGLLGTSLLGVGAMLAADDRLTWKAPTNQTDRDLFYAEGKKPYSVKIGDNWVPLINFGPFGLALSIPASAQYNFTQSPDSKNDNLAEKLVKSATDLGSVFSQQTFLQGVSNLFDVISGDDNANIEKLMAGLAGQTIPLNALIRYASTVTDPTYREADSFVDYIRRDIPVLSKGLEAQKNSVTGEDVKRNASDYVAPYSVGKPDDNPTRQKNTELTAEFYRAMGRGSNDRTKINEKITKALLEKDPEKAKTLARQYNEQLKSEAVKFKEKYGTQLESNPELRKRFNEEYKSRAIKLTSSSAKQRQKNQRSKTELSRILDQ